MTNQIPSNGEVTTKDGFGVREMTVRNSVAPQASALAARMVAEAQARFVMAMQRPRDLARTRQNLLKMCEIEGFADEAWYRKPVGQGVMGLSIRFAESAARELGNLDVRSFITYEDDDQLTVSVVVLDLETNHSDSRDITIAKVVERSSAKGREVVGTRKNKDGKDVFIVKATVDEMRAAVGSEVSRAKRNLILAMLPADIRGECVARILETRARAEKNERTEDPTARLKRMVDSFLRLGVNTADLADWLGHPVDRATREEIDDLGEVYRAMTSEESAMRWSQVIAARREQVEAESEKRKAETEKKQQAQQAKTTMRDKMREDHDDGAGPARPATPKPPIASIKKADLMRAAKAAGLANGGNINDAIAERAKFWLDERFEDLDGAGYARLVAAFWCSPEGDINNETRDAVLASLGDDARAAVLAMETAS